MLLKEQKIREWLSNISNDKGEIINTLLNKGLITEEEVISNLKVLNDKNCYINVAKYTNINLKLIMDIYFNTFNQLEDYYLFLVQIDNISLNNIRDN